MGESIAGHPDLAASVELAASLPLPGGGSTGLRWRWLAELARRDVVLGRMLEAHADALAILHELGSPHLAVPGSVWGVWASAAGGADVTASLDADGTWVLRGRKPYCSGAHTCTHALVTARDDGGRRLFAVVLDQAAVRPGSGGWTGPGMARTDTETVELDGAVAAPVGAIDAYYERPGFWHGAIGVAACWFGGARGVADALAALASKSSPDPHALAHLGAVDAALAAAWATLRSAAADIDEGADGLLPDALLPAVDADPAAVGHRRALRVRAVVERAATEVLDRTGRALGPGPLAMDAEHARRVADLQVYVRQSHAERDLAALGVLALGR